MRVVPGIDIPLTGSQYLSFNTERELYKAERERLFGRFLAVAD